MEIVFLKKPCFSRGFRPELLTLTDFRFFDFEIFLPSAWGPRVFTYLIDLVEMAEYKQKPAKISVGDHHADVIQPENQDDTILQQSKDLQQIPD